MKNEKEEFTTPLASLNPRVDELIKKIESEYQKVTKETYDAEGLARLQEVAAEYNGEYRLIWSEEIKARLEKQPRPDGYKIGMAGIDDLTGGFREQQLVTITAHSAHGKSAFGMFLTKQVEQLKPVMIPIEQTAEELIAQRMANGYHIPNFLSPERLADLVTTEWIEERIVEGIAKHNTKFVIIDHLGYIDNMAGNYKKENLAYRIGMVMKSLKNIAKRWNVVIVILVHISQHDEGKPPSLVDIGNSSDIIKESDIVMLLWRKNKLSNKVRIYDNKVLLSIQKNRFNGKNGNVGLVFDVETGDYKEENGWVESMEKLAQSEVESEDSFALF